MKKLFIFAMFAAVVASCTTSNKGYDARVIYANYNTLPYKVELIDAQRKALELADSVMSKNELFDADGSDVMARYLKAAAKVDSLNHLEQ